MQFKKEDFEAPMKYCNLQYGQIIKADPKALVRLGGIDCTTCMMNTTGNPKDCSYYEEKKP